MSDRKKEKAGATSRLLGDDLHRSTADLNNSKDPVIAKQAKGKTKKAGKKNIFKKNKV